MEEENKKNEENMQLAEQVSEPTQVEETSKVEGSNMKKKSNKPLLIVILIIFMGFIFGCGLCLGKQIFEDKKECPPAEKQNNKETPDNTETPTNTETVDGEKTVLNVNDYTVQKLIGIFGYNCNVTGEKMNTDNQTRLEIAYANLEGKYINTLKCVTASAKGALYETLNDGSQIIAYCGFLMSDEMSKNYSIDKEAFEKAALMNYTNVVYEEFLKAKYLELFSSSYEYKPERFGGCGFMEYNSNVKNYARYTIECGGTCGEEKQTVTSAYKQGNKLFIETDYDNLDGKMKVNYEFILENGTYKFLKVTEVK